MKRALIALLLVAAPASAQVNGWAEMANGWGEMQAVPGFATIPPPASATLGCVGVFLGSPLNLQCAPSSGIVYTVATKSLDVTDGRVQAGNVNAIPLPASGSVTVTNQGTAGATTYTYSLQACLADGTCNAAGPASTTTTGNATLSVTDFNRLTWSAVSGAASYKIRRDVGGATQGVIWSGTALTVDDVGLAGDGTAKPTVDGTGTLTGRGVLGNGTTVGVGTGTATGKIGGVVHVNVTPATTAGTSEEVLMTYTLPANTLNANGKIVRVVATGVHAANTNAVLFRIRAGGIGGTIMNSISSNNSAAALRLSVDVARTGAATEIFNALSTYATVASTASGSLTLDTTDTISFVVTATTATAAGDVTATSLVVEVLN